MGLGVGMLLLAPTLGWAQASPGVVEADAEARQLIGAVVGADSGAPLPEVVVVDEASGARAVSDAAGRFALPWAPGPRLLWLDGPLVEPQRALIEAAAPGVPVTIVAVEALMVDAVTVTAVAPPPGQTASTHVIDGERLAATPSRTADDALRLAPGLLLVQHGAEGKGPQAFVRGFDAQHGADLAVDLDGVPLNEWSSVHGQGYLDLALIVPEAIASVEVRKGPFALDDGAGAVAGAASYRLGAQPGREGPRVGYTYASSGRHRLALSFSPRDGDGGSVVAVEGVRDDGFGARRAVERAALTGRLRLGRVDAGLGELALTAAGAAARFELPGVVRREAIEAGLVDFHGAHDRLGDGDAARFVLAAAHARRAHGRRHQALAHVQLRALRLRENITGFLEDPVASDRREQRDARLTFGVEGRWEAPLSAGLRLRAGLGWRGDALTQSEDALGRLGQPLARRRDLRAFQGIGHLYAGLRWWLPADLRLDVGGRLDALHVAARDGLAGDALDGDVLLIPAPRLGLRWSGLEALTLFAAYGRGWRPPEARAWSRYEPPGAALDAERYEGGAPAATVADALELGALWRAPLGVSVTAAGFATFIDRESIYDHVSGVNLELNATRRLGAELTVAVEPWPWLHLGADVTWTQARFVDSGAPVPLVPWLMGGARGYLTLPWGLDAGLRGLIVAPRDLPHGARGATLVALDASVGYRWRGARLAVALENVPDLDARAGEYHFASRWDLDAPASALPVLHQVAGPPLTLWLTLELAPLDLW